MQIIIDDHLYLREIKLADADAVFSLIDQNRDTFRVWLPFVDYTREVTDTVNFIQSVINKNEDEKDFVFVMIFQQEIVGLIGFRGTDYTNRKTEIGYWIGSHAEGKGIVTRATKAAIDFAFNNLDMNRIIIRHAVGNTRSGKIPERLGFLFEGMERDGEKVNDVFYDLKVHSLLKREWQK